MQNLENSSFHGSREHHQEHHQQIRSQEILYQRHEPKEISDGRKLPGLIIEDETKNFVDGIDGDSSDGEPDSKVPRLPELRQKKTRGRVKIKMEFIENKLRRYTTFSKRKTGIMKKVCVYSLVYGENQTSYFLGHVLSIMYASSDCLCAVYSHKFRMHTLVHLTNLFIY